ncbi:MAG TPA: patatin-like phospholipase family protein [Anaerolineae bacterium]|nr:patatin-like phospholipase family protein [Anaerolineae bacterium]HNU05849.1 patatin-like phospholipase family protein [Anaerolineae bacterium]
MWRPRKRLGLALSGGVARGRAHVGVIQALEEAGIRADFVSGVSAGAMVAAAYAAGLDLASLLRLARSFSWPKVATPLLPWPRRGGLKRLGLVDFSPLELFMIRAMGDVTFEELALPLAIGATDLTTGERIILTHGRVARAVRASASVPGVVAPMRWRGRLLCDGFASNNLPIQILRDMGADVVLAVNIMPVAGRDPSNFFWAGSAALSALVMQASDPLDRADITVEPDLAETDYLFPRTEELLRDGHAATQAVLPQLRALLA